MSSEIKEYRFKPFKFEMINSENLPNDRRFTKMDHGVANDDEFIYAYECTMTGEFIPSTVGEMDEFKFGYLCKYSLVTNCWENVRCTNFPNHLKFNTILLSGNMIIIYGGAGTRFSEKAVYQTYIGNLSTEYTNGKKGVEFVEIPSTTDVPKSGYGQPLIMDGKYLYTVNGMSEHEYEMDVYRLDLEKKEWKSLFNAREAHPRNAYNFKNEIAFYNNRLFMFSRAQLDIENNTSVMFKKIHVFDLDTNEWQYFETLPELNHLSNGYPANRVHYGWTQCKVDKQYVYMCGGFNDTKFFTDVWRLDLSTFQWYNFVQSQLLKPTFFHSLTITNTGRMYYLDGMIGNCLPNAQCSATIDRLRENRIIGGMWIRIPKLADMCWDAVLHYFKDKLIAMSKEELQALGLPNLYCLTLLNAKKNVHV